MDTRPLILLIEDDPEYAQLIQAMLAKTKPTGTVVTPLDVEWTDRLSKGLQRLATGDIDLVLLDLLLPDSQGLDGFVKVQNQAPHVPIVVLSGLADETLATEAVRTGAQDYLLKGQMDSHLLVRAIRYAIERHRTEESLRQRNRELALLHHAGQAFSSTLDLDRVLDTVLEEARHLLNVISSSIWLIDPQTEELICGQITGPHTETLRGWRLAPGAGFVGWVAQQNESVMISDTRTDERHFKKIDQRTGVEIRSILSVPLRVRQDVIGVLELVDTEPNRFRTTDLALIEPLAATAAIAIQNARLYKETDQLRAFNENIVQSMNEGIFVYDSTGHITFVNPKGAEFSGYAPKELIGRHWREIIAPEHLAQVEQEAAKRLQGISGRYETVLMTREGQRTPVLVSSRPLFDDGRFDSVLVVCTDITERVRAEEALQISERRFRTLVEQSPLGIVAYQPDGNFVFDNEAAHRIFGLSQNGHNYLTSNYNILEDERLEDKGLMPYIKRAFAGEASAIPPIEYHPDRTQVSQNASNNAAWVESFIYPVKDKSGNIREVVLLHNDITERVRAERALRESEARYRSLTDDVLDSSAVGVVILDRDFRVTWVNQALERFFGMHRDEMVGKDKRQLILKRVKHIVEKSEAFAEQVLAMYEDNSHVAHFECHVLPDGERKERWLEHQSQPIRSGLYAGGRIEHYYDITERVRAEEERVHLLAQIQEQAQQMQQIIDTVPEGVLLLDADLRIVLTNPAAREALAVLADANLETCEPLTSLGSHAIKDILANHSDPLPVEITLATTPSRIFEAQAQPIGDGAARQWVLTLREVTQEREQQQQMQVQERLATVGQLAAGIAHDFNNIMASIVLYAGMLLRSPDLPPENQRRLDTIRQQGHRAANLVQQILDFARKSIMERQPLDLIPFLKELEKLLERTLPENIHILLEYEPDEYTVSADPTRIQQVVMNLALNARDAMPDGGELRFTLARLDLQPGQTRPLLDMPSGQWVRLNVVDTGTGIPPDVQPHIFEPFFTTKEVGKGTGLGLAQVYGIVHQHGGRIGVQSQVGRGTTFSIYLPVLALPEATPDTPHRESLIEGQGETILVVEDDETTREAIIEILEDLGYRVLAAANGQDALAIFDDEVALVLSDLVMPKTGGVALHTALKAQHPQVKMIVITGYPMSDGGKALLEQGITAWLQKPFSADEIAQMVRQALA